MVFKFNTSSINFDFDRLINSSVNFDSDKFNTFSVNFDSVKVNTSCAIFNSVKINKSSINFDNIFKPIFCQYQHIQYQFMVISRSSLINILLAQLSGKNLLCTFHKYKFIMFVSGLGHTTFVYSYQQSAKFHTFKCDKSWMSQLFHYIWKGKKSKIQK